MPYSVIIIDDEKWSIIDLLKSVKWESQGFNVVSYYTSPSEALDMVCRLRPDVVFTDIRMPKLSGIELIEQARRTGVSSEFVIISAYADFESAQKAFKFNVADYCLKPINPDSLTSVLSTIKERLDRKAAQGTASTAIDTCSNPEANSVCFQKILDYIKANISNKILLSDISEEFYVNKNYVCHLFQKNLNTTFSQYVTELRVNEAKRLLMHTGLTLEEIAKMTGFGDSFYFNKVFKKQEGISPGGYRKGMEGRVKQ